MNHIVVFFACFFIAAVACLQAASVHATEAAYRGAVAANWCNYLGPDCRPHGLSPRAYNVFRYMANPTGMSKRVLYEVAREMRATAGQLELGDPQACKEVKEIIKALESSSRRDARDCGGR